MCVEEEWGNVYYLFKCQATEGEVTSFLTYRSWYYLPGAGGAVRNVHVCTEVS